MLKRFSRYLALAIFATSTVTLFAQGGEAAGQGIITGGGTATTAAGGQTIIITGNGGTFTGTITVTGSGAYTGATTIQPGVLAIPKLQPNDVVGICGDSITEQRQYSVNMELYFLACQPAANIRSFQAGWGGEVAPGFLARLDRDVLPLKPTVVTTCYGMNDSGYGPMTEAKGQKYREATTAIVKKFKAAGVRQIVVGSSGPVDTTTWGRGNAELNAAQNKTLAALGEIGKDIAEKEGVTFADVYTPMMQAMTALKAKYGEKYHLAGGDGVHPDANGHLVMAYAFLKALGCDGNIGTITVDLATSKATATPGHTIKSAADGTIEVVSTRYPFCFTGDPKTTGATTGVIDVIPFNQDLNRFLLVINNATGKVKVTWGENAKEFSAEEAGKGINLAAAFLDNPFSAPFEKLKAAVQEQQLFETPLTKSLLHNTSTWGAAAPQEAEALNKSAINLDTALAARSAKTVEPVTHTIKIELVK